MEDLPIKIGIINCMMHKGNSAAFNYNENMETIEVTEKLLGKGAVGLDLAGFENNCDFREYACLFEEARKRKIPYTIHAGEMGVGSHILDALEMEPDRIGHGITSRRTDFLYCSIVFVMAQAEEAVGLGKSCARHAITTTGLACGLNPSHILSHFRMRMV